MPVLTNLGDSLGGLFGGGFTSASTPRVPFVLTSRLRLLATAPTNVLQAQRVLVAQGQGDQFFRPVNEPGRDLLRKQADMLGYTGPAFQAQIHMLMNFKSMGYDRPKRIAKRDVLDGSAFFHFTDGNGRNSDVLTLKFQGNTGSLDTVDAGGEEGPGGYENLIAWHNLFALSDEPMRLLDGSINQIRIDMATRLFRLKTSFFGHFGTNITFEESASKPNSVDYSFDFVVHRTSPDIYTMADRLYKQKRAETEVVEVPSPTDGDRG